MQRKLNCSKRTEEVEEETPDGIPGPTMVWLFKSSFAYMIYFVFLKKKQNQNLTFLPHHFELGLCHL